MGTFGSRLKEFRNYMGLKQTIFASQAGLSQANITQWEKDRGKPDSENMNKLERAYPELNKIWLLKGEGKMLNSEKNNNIAETKTFKLTNDFSTKPYSKQQSLYKSTNHLTILPMNALAGYAETVSDVEVQENFEYAILPDYAHCDTIVEVDGDSMYPTFCSRDRVICKKMGDWDYIEAGKPYIINVKGQFVIKRVFEIDGDDDHINLISDNEKFYPKQRIRKEWILGMFKVHGVISNNTGHRKVA